MTRAFVSYSHADESYRAELEKHLSLLRKQGLIDLWHDHRIPIGGEIDRHVSAELEGADLILMLVSADFMASDYCYGIEMTRALARHAAGTAIVVPLIVRPCDWHSAPFGRLKALPQDGKPISKWTAHDDAFVDIVQSLRQLVAPRRESLSGTATPLAPEMVAGTPLAAERPRSSTLALRKKFSDIDRDRFLEEGFAYIRAFLKTRWKRSARAIRATRRVSGRFPKRLLPAPSIGTARRWQDVTSASVGSMAGARRLATPAMTTPRTIATTRCCMPRRMIRRCTFASKCSNGPATTQS
ncbi:toll/interleukin-1 receptor domain-containing protein [Cupriavidus sp. EM10]|nr:toll/interleukin-1 receptor domain-containing protein [Cupriavidus sp. EM10]